MSIIIVLILIIVAANLIARYWNFTGFVLKNFFKVKNISDVFTILFIGIFSLSFAGLTFLTFEPPGGCGQSSAEIKVSLKKVISMLNQSIYISKQLGEETPSTCKECISNERALAAFFMKRLNVIEYANNTKVAQEEFPDKPAFSTSDGMLYIVEKAKGRCGDIKTVNPDKANCVIIVDVNGFKRPNKFSTGNKKNKDYKMHDRFRVVVLKETVEPAANEENDFSDYILHH